MIAPGRISIELGNRSDEDCGFCYAGSEPEGETRRTVETALEFVRDCATNGVRATSFGGGEALQWPGLFELLRATAAIPVADTGVRSVRSLTTNVADSGLPGRFRSMSCLFACSISSRFCAVS